jgi:competence protein ComEC
MIVSLTIGIILGVVMSFAINIWLFSSPLWLAVAAALLVFSILKPKPLTLLLALLSGLLLGSFRANLDLGDRAYIDQFIGQSIEIKGTISEDPDLSDGKLSLRLNHLIFGDTHETSGTIYVQLSSRSQNLRRSDIVTLKGKLSSGFGSFAATLFRPELLKIERPDPPDLALELRDDFADAVKEHVEEPEVDLALGYLLGARRSLPSDLLDTLKIVGLTHIIVASGYNLSVLVRFSRRIFGKLSRFAALFISLLLIAGFISITGFSPSMARAGLVAILSLLAWYYGRRWHPAKLLLLVAAATLLINPTFVLDLGWLLSFAAFAGVMLLAPLITSYFYGAKKPNFVAQLILETISAQLLCLPIIIFVSGNFSIISIIANILILPTIPLTMLLTFITGLISALPAAALTGQLTTWLLDYNLKIINFFGAQTQFLVEIPAGNPAIFLIYPPILALALYFRKATGYRLHEVNVVQ